jgi:hypothetical protein
MSAAAEAGASNGVAWYVYGIVEAGSEAPAGAGVEVSTVTAGRVSALVSRVPLEEYGEDAVRARLEDPAWLAGAAHVHEAVLEAALRSGAVVPFRLLTIFRDCDGLHDFLATRGDDLRALLERVRGREEVGVKAFVDRAVLDEAVAADTPALRELDAEIASAQIGRAYLLQRRREQALDQEAGRRIAELAGVLHGRLRDAAEAGVANAVQSHEASGRAEEMVLNGAYLVPSGDDRFERELDALREEYRAVGVTFERTGPWPPYNFVPRELGEA